MLSRWNSGTILRAIVALAVGVALTVTAPVARAQQKPPIKIGFSMALTGALAGAGKSGLLAIQLWAKDQNAKGGLLGRPVQLVYYDDQTNPSTVPGIYTKLLDVDKVDLVVGPYGTVPISAAMPIIMAHKMTFLALLGLGVNTEFHYPNYFAMIPSGPSPKESFTKGFFDVAMQQKPKPKTVAVVGSQDEFSTHLTDGAVNNAKAAGLKIVYHKGFPPNTTDCSPIMRAVNATNPDLIVVGTYPPGSICMVHAMNEVGTKAKLFGGGMVGLQYTAIKQQLGAGLNGIVNYDVWVPAKTMMFPGLEKVLKEYQAAAPAAGVDPLGYYMAPISYAYMQILADAVTATKGFNQQKLADYIRSHTFKTVFGDIKFGKGGEWAKSRVLQVQFRQITGNGIDQFKDPSKVVVVDPASFQSAKVLYPMQKARAK
ncbi:MAG: amino acid ABC transporter substrate-binding protein [Alphaproteobacteria bacterium]|nr:amino acid ABC transporter substrate-binding protein [Alphaproteobacteria bacterium]